MHYLAVFRLRALLYRVPASCTPLLCVFLHVRYPVLRVADVNFCYMPLPMDNLLFPYTFPCDLSQQSHIATNRQHHDDG